MSDDLSGADGTTMERALRAIRDLRSKVARLEGRQNEPIAIIGMGCRFPGAPTLDAFWRLLVEGEDPLGPVPRDRWNVEQLYSADPLAPGKTVNREGGYLPGLDMFDAAFFGISPREAPFVDPRQRLILETTWEALDDAGIPVGRLARSATAVVVGTLTNDYNQLITADDRWVSASTGTGTSTSIIANRVSYLLDLHGPSLTLDTACSGSLTALHLACQTLRNGEAALALCGGVAVNLVPAPDICFSRMGALSPKGRCRTFDAASDGMTRSEGAGMIVLKRLADAEADGDRIYALIRASAVNHDGRSNGIAAPSGQAQERLLREAYAKAGVSPGLVQYVEAHGTGTILGDRIELQALAAVLGTDRAVGRPCAVGSVKSNIGHTESAAGIAGIIKTALALKHGLLPGNLHFETPHPALAEAGFPIEVRTAAAAFPRPEEKVVAGVSGFSFGGANAHVVLEQAPARVRIQPPADAALILPLSAASNEALRAMAQTYVAWLHAPDVPSLADICMTAALRRTPHPHRLAVVGRSADELAARLEAFLTGDEEPHVAVGIAGPASDSRLAFAFSGQGSHWLGMGRALYAEEMVFRAVVDRCDALLLGAGWSLIDQLHAGPEASRLDEIDVVQPAIFAVQAGLTALLAAWGVKPDVVFGQSMGEVAAAHAAGVLSIEDAMLVVLERSRLLRTKRGAGATAVIGLPAAQIADLLSERFDEVAIAGTTSFTSTLVAGNTGMVDALVAELDAEGVFCRLLGNVDVPAHSPVMDSLRPHLIAALDGLSPQRGSAASFFSTVTLAREDGAGLDAAYWGRNLREPFRVAEAVAQLASEGVGLFLEISSHPVIAGAIRQSLHHVGADGIALGSLGRDQDCGLALRTALGALWVHGYALDFARLLPGGAQCVSLPAYPWQREHFWVDQIAAATGGRIADRAGRAHPLLGTPFAPARGAARYWESELDAFGLSWVRHHCIRGLPVLPGAAYLEMMLAAAREALGWEIAEIEGARFERMLPLAEGQPRQCQVVLRQIAREAAEIEILSRPVADNPDWTLHASGSVRHRRDTWSDSAPRSPAPASAEALSTPAFYRRLATGGLEYGPLFQGVQVLQRAGREAWAVMALPEGTSEGFVGFHPALLDAAFQTVAAILPSGADETAASVPVYLPRGAAHVSLTERLDGQLTTHAVLAPSSEVGAAIIDADVTLFDCSGLPCGRVSGLRLSRVDEIAAAEATIEDAFVEIVWEAKPRPAATAVPPQPGLWLLVGSEGAGADALADRLRGRGCDARLVGPHEDVAAAIADGGQDLRGVVQLGAANAPDAPAIARAALVERGLPIVQALARSPVDARFWIVTRKAAGDDASDGASLAQAALWGFGRVVAIEHPERWGGLLDVGHDPDWDAVLDDVLDPTDDREIVLHEDRRVARLDGLSKPEAKPDPVTFRTDAAYLITGGLSGLGLETARWMAARGARRLILVGRTPLPQRRLWSGLDPAHAAARHVASVRDLEALGVAVEIACFDIADETRLVAFIKDRQDEALPPIRGIIHAAGIVQDALLMRMTAVDAEAVMAPKVAGSWALHRASLALDLDFLVFYSSASAIMGQVGQAAYAAANAFEDGLARHRRALGLPALSINWGPWAQIGLFARLGLSDRAGLSGIVEIAPDLGMAALDRLMGLDVTQCMVMNADWSVQPAAPRLERLQRQESSSSIVTEPLGLLDMLLMDAVERRAELRRIIGAIVAAALRFDETKLDHKRPLTTLGMDSIMAVEIRNRIRRRFDTSPAMIDLFSGSVGRLADIVDEALAQDQRLSALLDEIETLQPDRVEALLASGEPVA